LAAERKTNGGDDPGLLTFARLAPRDLYALRTQVGSALSEAAPTAKRRLIDLRTPPREPTRLAPAYVSVGETPADLNK
jgi:hypothetical protein